MPEAVETLVYYCFKELKLDFLIAGYYNHNKQSKRVQEKCGFVFLKEKTFKTKLGEYDGILMIIEKDYDIKRL